MIVIQEVIGKKNEFVLTPDAFTAALYGTSRIPHFPGLTLGFKDTEPSHLFKIEKMAKNPDNQWCLHSQNPEHKASLLKDIQWYKFGKATYWNQDLVSFPASELKSVVTPRWLSAYIQDLIKRTNQGVVAYDAFDL